jgi:hypothetical protein
MFPSCLDLGPLAGEEDSARLKPKLCGLGSSFSDLDHYSM